MKRMNEAGRRLALPRAGSVLGALALMVALGGTAQALSGTDTVQHNDLKDDVVHSQEIKSSAVKSSDIKAGAVEAAELGTIVARVDTTSIADGASGNATASCLAGERMIGGGGHTQQSAADAVFHGSFPSNGNVVVANGNEFDDWTATASNATGGLTTVDVKAWAICLQ